MNKLVQTLSLSILLVTWTLCPRELSSQVPQISDLSKSIQVDGMYYGTTNDTLGVRKPWLFYFNTKLHKGSELNFREFQDVRIDSEGILRFTNEDIDTDKCFSFEGSSRGDRIEGLIIPKDGSPRFRISLSPVNLTQT